VVKSHGVFPSTGCMVPQPFAAGGNQLYPEFWAVTYCLLFPGYITLTIALEPSVERVVRVDHSMVGRTGTHMVLWALPWDSVARLQGGSLHDLDWESYGGAHRVASEAVSEVKAKSEANFHMYC
jgi:hypothetical protein